MLKLRLVELLTLLSHSHAANDDLILANSGHKLGMDNSLKRNILTGKPSYSNVFGRDSELESIASTLKVLLNDYRLSHGISVEEWMKLKALAASAAKGDCTAADQLYELGVLPRIDYDRLLGRCGRGETSRAMISNLEELKQRELAGDSIAHANMDHIRKHQIARSIDGGASTAHHDAHILGSSDVNYGIHTLGGSKGAASSIFNNAGVKSSAMDFLARNTDGIQSKLAHINSPFSNEVLDRIEKTKHLAEDVVEGRPGAEEQFIEMESNNRSFSEKMLGHTGMDEEVRSYLNAGDKEIIVPSLHLDALSDHIIEDLHLNRDLGIQSASPHIIGFDNHLNNPSIREAEAHNAMEHAAMNVAHLELDHAAEASVNGLGHIAYEGAIAGGGTINEANAAANQGVALGMEYEKEVELGQNKSSSGANSVLAVEASSGLTVPNYVLDAFSKFYGFSNQDKLDMKAKISQKKHQELVNLNEPAFSMEARHEAEILNAAADEIAHREQVVRQKASIAEAKINEAERKINDQKLAVEAFKLGKKLQSINDITRDDVMDKLQTEQIESLVDKKTAYDQALKEYQSHIGDINDVKGIEELGKVIQEQLTANKKIVEAELKVKQDALNVQSTTVPCSSPQISTEEINSRNELSAEKKNARIVESGLAKEAEEKEIRESREIAVSNVLRLGGTPEQAAVEGDKAELLKRKEIEVKKMEHAAEISKLLEKQVDQLTAVTEAQHLAFAHSGRNPMGNSVVEIEDHEKNVNMEEESKKFLNKQTEGEKYKIVKVIPDNVSQISVDNSVLDLPLQGIPDAKAQTKEEEEIKQELAKVRDELRNKVTLNNYNTGLVTIKGIEGILNLPESCVEIEVKKGTIYFDRARKNEMEAQGIDVTPLKPVYSKGDEPLYYKAQIKDMKMKLPSVLNSSFQSLLYNDFETINISYGKRIEIVNGVVICKPWSVYGHRIMRPEVYAGESRGGDSVPDSIKDMFNRMESEKNGLNKTDVTVMKNPDGVLIAEIKPQYGMKSKVGVDEAVKKVNEIKKSKINKKLTTRDLNIGNEDVPDFTKEFIKSVEKEIKDNKEYESVLNEYNPLLDKVSSDIKNIVKTPELHDVINNYKRNGNDEETKAFNNMADNSEKISEKLHLKPKEFLDNLSKIDRDTLSGMIEYFIDMSGSVDYHKKLAFMDQKPFYKKIQEVFTQHKPTEVIDVFFDSFSTVLRIPSKLNGTPITSMIVQGQSKQECCIPNMKMANCLRNCHVRSKNPNIRPKIKRAMQKTAQYKMQPLQKLIETKADENIVVLQKNTIQTNPPTQIPPSPINICKGNQNMGCLVLGGQYNQARPTNLIRLNANFDLKASAKPKTPTLANPGTRYYQQNPCENPIYMNQTSATRMMCIKPNQNIVN